MLKASVLFPAGNGVFPDPIFIDDYKDIQSLVGGFFTTVSLNTSADGEPISLVGYLPDDVRERNNRTINWFASALFGQELYGPCVVAWGLSPNGFNDGDIYDMPDGMSEWLFGKFTEKVLEAYAEANMMTVVLHQAMDAGVITQQELDSLMDFIEAMTGDDTGAYTDEDKVGYMLLLNRIENHILVTEKDKASDDK